MLRLCAVLLTVVVCVELDPVVGDMTKEELTKLYNTPVQTAEVVVRPKQNLPDGAKGYPFTHSGVRVTLVDGQQYLIHKGPNYGDASDTVVTEVDNMSDRWRGKETVEVDGRRSVGVLVDKGGTDYKLLGANCHEARKKIMQEAKAARKESQAEQRQQAQAERTQAQAEKRLAQAERTQQARAERKQAQAERTQARTEHRQTRTQQRQRARSERRQARRERTSSRSNRRG